LDGCTEYRWPLLFCPGSSFRSRLSLGDGTGNGLMISLRPLLITEHHSVSSLNNAAREASHCSKYLRPARDVDTTCTVGRNVHESMATTVRAHRAPNLLRGCVGRSHVDHTEARNDFVGCFGRSDRRALGRFAPVAIRLDDKPRTCHHTIPNIRLERRAADFSQWGSPSRQDVVGERRRDQPVWPQPWRGK
jgi:hypothetical protein